MNPFPIELLYFDAIPNEHLNKVDLSWATMSEINNRHFQIQRSADGRNWQSITQIQGAGNSVEENSYSSKDHQPLNGMSYYRLKQVDFDGVHSFSAIKAVQFNHHVLFSPNPSSGMVLLNAESNVTTYVELLDANGRVVFNNSYRGSSNINFSHLPKGLYIFRTFAHEKVTFDKLILLGSNDAKVNG